MGFSISLIKDHQSALSAIQIAIEKAGEDRLFNPKKLIVHSDQGSAYLSNEYIAYLEHTGIQISMTDASKPTQNPYIEAFISLISSFWLNHFEYLTFYELDQSI